MSDLSQVIRPVSQARGLPNAHYIDETVFAEERDAVLFDNWAGIGFAHDVPAEGDAMPIDFLGMPLLMLRDHDNQVRVYQNTCRHRGMVLIHEKGNIRGTIRCPYHSWCYGLNGKLRSTPHVGGPGKNVHEDIKREALGLIEFPSYEYLGVIFVNISGNAAPFEETHRELLSHWSDFNKPIFYAEDGYFELNVKSNWKLAVENYCESYHLPWVHPGLNTVSRLEDHYHLEERLKYSGQGSTVFTKMRDKDGRGFPDFQDMPSKWDTASEYVALYPNVLLGVHLDHVFAIILVPKSTEETQERIALYYADAQALGAEYDALRRQNASFWKEVFEEDIFVVEGMQRGRHGQAFDGGKFSPAMDGPTHLFHEWVATELNKHRELG